MPPIETGRLRGEDHSAASWPGAVLFALLFVVLLISPCVAAEDAKIGAPRPSILFAMSDDQSWRHAGAYGCRAVKTPHFDRTARSGVLFRNAFSASPGCSPSRAALLTGRYPWELEHAGTHASSFSKRFAVYPDLLEEAGYHVGYTGKGWGPGNFREGGRQRNPAGPAYNSRRLASTPRGISARDYAGNFRDFLEARPAGKPFCFWFGGHEPHRSYLAGAGRAAAKALDDVDVPGFLPDLPGVRSDLLDYLVEIEWFDRHLGEMLDALRTAGRLDETIVVVTSDNGMPFPRAKANCYEYGTHVPLAISWPARVPGKRVVDDVVSLVDLAPTFLEAAGVDLPGFMSGRSLLPILLSKKEGKVEASRRAVFTARERHSSSRHRNLGYPSRAIRTQDFLYIRNFHPERWPAGDPVAEGIPESERRQGNGGYFDIDGCPTKTLLYQRRTDPGVRRYFELAVARRPAEELYDIRGDPACLQNLVGRQEHAETHELLRKRLEAYLEKTGDPRAVGEGEVFETYRRYSRLRKFPRQE